MKARYSLIPVMGLDNFYDLAYGDGKSIAIHITRTRLPTAEMQKQMEIIVNRSNVHDDLVAALKDAPVLSKYHGQHGFYAERFIADYEAWRAQCNSLLEETHR